MLNNAAPEDDVQKLEAPIDRLEIKDGQWMGATVRSQVGPDGKVCEIGVFSSTFW